MKLFGIPLLAALLISTPSFAREWLNSEGRKIEAEFVELDGEVVVLEMEGKTYRVPLDKLSEADREFAREQADSAGDEPEPPGDLNLAGKTLEAGKLQTVELPLSEENRKIAKDGARGWRNSFGDNYQGAGNWFETVNEGHDVESMDLQIGLPPKFNPEAGTWPVFIAWSNVQSAGSNANGARAFWSACRDKGWILLSIDPKPDAKKLSTTPVYFACLKQAIEEMHAAWPASKQWPVCAGGSSGGAKASQWMGPLVTRIPDTDFRGLWLSACNEGRFFIYAKDDLKVSGKAIRQLKVAISTGTKDNLVDDAAREAVLDGVKEAGIRDIKIQTHDGGHGIHSPHIPEALDWLLAE